MVSNSNITFPRDTIAICWEKAAALQMNRIFGVEAAGSWSTIPDLIPSDYIRESPSSSPYAGAMVFNGKTAYKDGKGKTITYRGNPAQAIEFDYEVTDGCLKETYKVVIVLTNN
jgi:hypothetical protein